MGVLWCCVFMFGTHPEGLTQGCHQQTGPDRGEALSGGSLDSSPLT